MSSQCLRLIGLRFLRADQGDPGGSEGVLVNGRDAPESRVARNKIKGFLDSLFGKKTSSAAHAA
jgi:hypothetical protein